MSFRHLISKYFRAGCIMFDVICSDLTLANNADLAIGPNAILIDRGNYTSGNQAEVSNGVVMVPVLIKNYLFNIQKLIFNGRLESP